MGAGADQQRPTVAVALVVASSAEDSLIARELLVVAHGTGGKVNDRVEPERAAQRFPKNLNPEIPSRRVRQLAALPPDAAHAEAAVLAPLGFGE